MIQISFSAEELNRQTEVGPKDTTPGTLPPEPGQSFQLFCGDFQPRLRFCHHFELAVV